MAGRRRDRTVGAPHCTTLPEAARRLSGSARAPSPGGCRARGTATPRVHATAARSVMKPGPVVPGAAPEATGEPDLRAISARIARAAAAGSGAAMTGRPTTMKSAPAARAAAGVAVRFWSSGVAPSGRTPGVTMSLSRAPGRARRRAASIGEAMTPSAPAANARAARSSTISSRAPSRMRAASRSARSSEVRMVTARMRVGVAARPATAARTTCGSPCTVRKSGSSRAVISRTARVTVAPMSKSLRSRKTRLPSPLRSAARSRPPEASRPRPSL